MGTPPHNRRAVKRIVTALVQTLEQRRLFSTINVTDWGASIADAGDDRAGIINAINHSIPGDTIFFPRGIYRVAQQIKTGSPGLIKPLGQGRTYTGETNVYNGTGLPQQIDDASILIATNGDFIFRFQETNANNPTALPNVTWSHLTMEGNGIFFDTEMPGGTPIAQQMVEGVVIDNNHFKITGGGNMNGVQMTTGLRDTRITNNVFDPIIGDNGIYGYYWDNLVIANNEFLNGNEGMHLTDFGDNSKDLLIEQNYFSGLHRMAIEYQGYGANSIVQDNYYDHPAMTSNRPENGATFAYSIITDGLNPIVRRNTSIAPERPDGIGVRIIFEIGGTNAQVYDNYSLGGNNVVAVNSPLATAFIHDNKFIGYLEGVNFNNGSHGAAANNGPGVTLTWDINRPRPRPNMRYDGTGLGPVPLAPTNLAAVNVGLSQVNFTWSDNSSDEIGFSLERLGDDGLSWLVMATLSSNVASYSVTGMAAGVTYQFRIRAFNINGYSNPSNIAVVKTPVAEDIALISGRRTRSAYAPRGGIINPIYPPITPIA